MHLLSVLPLLMPCDLQDLLVQVLVQPELLVLFGALLHICLQQRPCSTLQVERGQIVLENIESCVRGEVFYEDEE